jgi:hypothetical protein
MLTIQNYQKIVGNSYIQWKVIKAEEFNEERIYRFYFETPKGIIIVVSLLRELYNGKYMVTAENLTDYDPSKWPMSNVIYPEHLENLTEFIATIVLWLALEEVQ